jgi:1-aminocyclopropane-1-carboxylate deaminase/D-cysteine desulfhydrase-like pyridoxal-dependent ACC family enzyme
VTPVTKIAARGPALVRWLPALERQLPWAPLGDWPTPLEELRIDGRPLWIKREGDSSSRYGGNKVRTLEAWLGHARARGARRIWAIGAYGSNHAIATVLHARALGIDAGAIVFPQPHSRWAAENAGALIASGCPLVRLRSVIEVPIAGAAIARRERDSVVMPPGGATPIGTLGALSAVFELAEQIADGRAPAPRTIVLPIGSTCTTAGLVAGFALASAAGAWRWPIPIVHGVRVTPWPVTSRLVIAQLASMTLARIAKLGGPDVPLPAPRFELDLHELAGTSLLGLDLGARKPLLVDRREIGAGYGKSTSRGLAALAAATPQWPRLDGVYSAKAMAAALRLHRNGVGPLLFWATKSTTQLAPPTAEALRAAPPKLARWLQ